MAIGHTRWATHGKPSDENSHPHSNAVESISVVHNGIIENYIDIKKELIEKGYEFLSDTDTEVLAHLLDLYSEEDFFCYYSESSEKNKRILWPGNIKYKIS